MWKALRETLIKFVTPSRGNQSGPVFASVEEARQRYEELYAMYSSLMDIAKSGHSKICKQLSGKFATDCEEYLIHAKDCETMTQLVYFCSFLENVIKYMRAHLDEDLK